MCANIYTINWKTWKQSARLIQNVQICPYENKQQSKITGGAMRTQHFVLTRVWSVSYTHLDVYKRQHKNTFAHIYKLQRRHTHNTM